MRKLALDDVRPPRLYERVRAEARRRVIELKRARRVALGPCVTLVFENRDTVRFQIEEMLRAEHVEDPARIREEIESYNALLPDEGALAATLFVEVVGGAAIRDALQALAGIDEHLALEAGGAVARGAFEAGRAEADRISAVQYVRFPLPPPLRAALATPGATIALVSDHPEYRHRVTLSDATRASLADDLA